MVEKPRKKRKIFRTPESINSEKKGAHEAKPRAPREWTERRTIIQGEIGISNFHEFRDLQLILQVQLKNQSLIDKREKDQLTQQEKLTEF